MLFCFKIYHCLCFVMTAYSFVFFDIQMVYLKPAIGPIPLSQGFPCIAFDPENV